MSQFNQATYDIERPTGQCAFTGRTLEPKETYIATLVEYEEPAGEGKGGTSGAGGLGLKRVDVSMEAWERGRRPENLFSFWKSTIPEPQEKKKLFVDDDVLLNLFRRLEDTDRADRLAFRFVLGLILMRKRILRYEGSETRVDEEGREQTWWRMVHKARGAEPETLEMLDPHLDEARIQQVSDQLSEILEAEL